MPEVRLPGLVKATPVENALKAEDVAGCFSFEEAPAPAAAFWGWIKFRCPCGCRSYSRLPIGLNVKPPRGVDPGGVAATWQWDGNREAPTLHPSIHHVDHWHGWLRAGVWADA